MEEIINIIVQNGLGVGSFIAFLFFIFRYEDKQSDTLNKISDNLYLSNRQIEILKRYEIDYKKFNDIKSLMYEVETALEEVYDADDLQALSIELSEFNYYHNTNK